MSLNDSITGDGMVCQPIGYMKPDDKDQLERSGEVKNPTSSRSYCHIDPGEGSRRMISLSYQHDLHSRDAVCFSPGKGRNNRAGHVAFMTPGIHDSSLGAMEIGER